MTSSRRSSTSAPPEITFFTDRDLGLQFPDILRQAGLRVERHADHFAPDCPDVEWLEAVTRRGWTAVTHDARIRYKPNELAAVEAHKVALLVIVGHAPYADLANRSSPPPNGSSSSSASKNRRSLRRSTGRPKATSRGIPTQPVVSTCGTRGEPKRGEPNLATQMRVLHEDVIGRIALLQEGLIGAAKRRSRKK